ncbi:hypothetical protein R3W88_012337 [Solanum pinnatisectum]|uniref:F-box domain-containing protein n=1 Tax=Solanum pinnatisectum TaxID=50273 RepID=A0AAV9LBK8_9SOLN|nr:hypothetical protein R3W88_012337 [Solanum pinnatisectum]
MAKRRQQCCGADQDHISKLPDEILAHILSFLTVKEAADTIVLNPMLQKMYMNKYITWVNPTLKMCKVCFDLNKLAQHDIDNWIEFAVARQVQRLELDLLECGEFTQGFGNCVFNTLVSIMNMNMLLNLIPQLTMLKKFVLVVEACEDRSILKSKRECKKVVSCPLHHLKVIKYFLENAIVLEKILVDPHDFRYKAESKENKYVRKIC